MKPQLSQGGRLVVLATLVLAALWAVLAFLTWGDAFNGPRFGDPWTTYRSDIDVSQLTDESPWLLWGSGQGLLFSGGLNGIALLAAIIQHAAAALIGMTLIILPVWGRRIHIAIPWLLAAGVVPGALVLIALTRVVTLFTNNPMAPGIIGALTIVLVGLSAVLLARSRNDREAGLNADWRDWAALVAVSVGVLIFSVHVDLAHVAAEGSVWFLNALYKSADVGIGSEGRFPIISQHYDEAALLYPVIYGLVEPGHTMDGTITAIYWVMLALGRISVVALTYIAVRGLGVDRLSCLVVVGFVSLASLSLNPATSRLLFDSLSPLGYTLHIARMLIPVLPVLLLSAYAQGIRATPMSMALAVVLGFALSSMPVHGVLTLVFAFVVAAFTWRAPEAGHDTAPWRLLTAIAGAILLAFTMAYGAPFLSDTMRAIVLLVAALGCGLGAIWRVITIGGGREHEGGVSAKRDNVIIAGIMLGGCAIGLLFGNLLVQPVWPALATLWPWNGMSLLDRATGELTDASYELARSQFCAGGAWWADGRRFTIGHCGTLPMFVRTYGLPFVVIAVVAVLAMRRLPAVQRDSDSVPTIAVWGMMLCLVAMPIGFVIFDFISQPANPNIGAEQLNTWLRSRLLEPWFYSGLLLALCVFLRDAPHSQRFWVQTGMLAAIAMFALNPFTFPAQLVANAAYLFATIAGL